MDLTPVLNQLLAQHNAQPIEPYVFRIEALDEFLKEAYRIVSHVAHTIPDQATNGSSEHIFLSYGTTSSRYGRATSRPHILPAGSSIRGATAPQRPETRNQST